MTNKQIYLKYLIASIASAVIVSIYCTVDSICVGQYCGEVGSAAIAAAMPCFTIMYSFGILYGVGGGTLLSSFKAKGDEKQGNRFFTLSLILTGITAIIIWIIFILLKEKMLIFFGAKDENVLDAALNYLTSIMYMLPIFVFINTISAFVRNDNDPTLATIASVVGGIVNIIGDIFLVFDFGAGLGIVGAGLATTIGQTVTVLVLLTHFFKKCNSLKLELPKNIIKNSCLVYKTGVSAFLLDMCMGVVVIIFNNQINKYTNNNPSYLAVYGIICNTFTLVQSFAYAVGQANQPLLSKSYGIKSKEDIIEFHKYGLITSLIIGIIWFLLFMIIPKQLIMLFIDTKDSTQVLEIGPKLIRQYYCITPIIVLNVYATYYFQSILKPRLSLIISLVRGFIVPVILLFIAPLISFNLIWFVIPIAEIISFGCNITFHIKSRISFDNVARCI